MNLNDGAELMESALMVVILVVYASMVCVFPAWAFWYTFIYEKKEKIL